MIGFIIGCFVGGIVGVFTMCLFSVSGAGSHRDEREHK